MNLDRWAAKTIKYTFYLLFLTVPIIFLTGHVELFQFNKMIVVYLGTIIITTAWIIRMISQRKIFIRRTPLDIPLLLFLASQIMSTILSIEPHTSIWGYYSRFHGGLLSTISYILLYYAFVSNVPASSEDAGDKFVKRARFSGSGVKFSQAATAIRMIWSVHQSTASKRRRWRQIFAGRLGQAFSLVGYPRTLDLKQQPLASKKISVASDRALPTFLLILLLSSTIVSIYGILEHFGIDEHFWVQDVRDRVFSTMGQPNWLAAFLVMIFPLSLTRTVLVNRKLSLVLSSILYITLLYTKSRSGLLGFTLMYLVFWGLLLLKQPVKKLLRSFLQTTAIITVISLVIGTPFTPSLSELIRSTPPSQSTITEGEPRPTITGGEGGTPSEEIRKIVWRGAVDVWRHWPLFGSGVETFAYSYYNFRPVEHNFVSEWDFLYNKAHNEYLNILANTGLVGLLSLLLLQGGYTVWSLKEIFSLNASKRRSWRARKTLHHLSASEGVGDKFVPASWARLKAWLDHLVRKPTSTASFEAKRISVAQSRANSFATEKISVTRPLTTPLLPALLSGYLGLQVAIFFGFSTVTTGLLMFMYPAFAVAAASPEQYRSLSLSNKKPRQLGLFRKILLIVVLLIGFYFVVQIGVRWYADRLFATGRSLTKANRMSEGLINMQKASDLVPKEPLFHDALSLEFARSAVALSLSGDATSAAQLAQAAAVHSDITVVLNPVHINYLKNRAAVMLHLASIDERYRQFAIETLQRAGHLAPTDPNVPYNLGLIYSVQDDPENAVKQQVQAVALKPDYELPRIALAEVLEKLGRPDQAIEVYQDFLNYAPGNQTALQAIERLATQGGVRSKE